MAWLVGRAPPGPGRRGYRLFVGPVGLLAEPCVDLLGGRAELGVLGEAVEDEGFDLPVHLDAVLFRRDRGWWMCCPATSIGVPTKGTSPTAAW
ncbi:hypothetical protein GBA65_15805 [Rubrobacter marinus]|uniref:Uncharacterized protein n=1 Tax=Rubrobacter marinus TaxID=2653852 RepID=A0A6G8PZX4_9ACTN|nr:hypothetical protein [Rubrobacter marinus]QIN79756.1 hypothetical protein GBA65_15805 [Rubrobacter marinus]